MCDVNNVNYRTLMYGSFNHLNLLFVKLFGNKAMRELI